MNQTKHCNVYKKKILITKLIKSIKFIDHVDVLFIMLNVFYLVGYRAGLRCWMRLLFDLFCFVLFFMLTAKQHIVKFIICICIMVRYICFLIFFLDLLFRKSDIYLYI